MEALSMAILFRCKCGRELRAKPDLAGKKTKCPECQAILMIPRPEGEKPAKPEPASKPADLAAAAAPIAFDDDFDLPRVEPLARAEPPSSAEHAATPTGHAHDALAHDDVDLPPGAKQYKVLTPKDMGFVAKFDAERLEKRLNELSATGWRLASSVVVKLPGATGVHDELIMVMERTVGEHV
jgi:hypothetical protein